MRIVLNEVGVFRVRFLGFQACKNPSYVMAKFQFQEFEMDGTVTNPSQIQTIMILHEAANIQVFNNVTDGQLCHAKISVGFQKANNRDGKDYPAGVRFRILQLSPVKES